MAQTATTSTTHVQSGIDPTQELLHDELKSLAILYAEQGQPKEALTRFDTLMTGSPRSNVA